MISLIIIIINLIIIIIIIIIINKLDSLEDDILVKQAFIMTKTLNDTGYKNLHSYIQGLLDKSDRPTTDILYPFSTF